MFHFLWLKRGIEYEFGSTLYVVITDKTHQPREELLRRTRRRRDIPPPSTARYVLPDPLGTCPPQPAVGAVQPRRLPRRPSPVDPGDPPVERVDHPKQGRREASLSPPVGGGGRYARLALAERTAGPEGRPEGRRGGWRVVPLLKLSRGGGTWDGSGRRSAFGTCGDGRDGTEP